MGNILNGIKKFIANKNTVTILVVLIGIIVLWAFYSWRVNQATTPIKVPYAKNVLNATDEITEDDIGYVEVNSKFLNSVDIIRNKSELVGKYVTTGTSIPEGGLFYTIQVVEKSDLPNTLFDDIPKDYTPYSLAVNNHTTFGNAIYPGDKIDLYMKATSDEGKIIYGKLIEDIEVLGVRDSNGKDVFSLGSTATPAELLFSVDNDMYELLKKTEYISGVTLVPVIRGKNQDTGSVKTYAYLRDFILAKTEVIPETTTTD